MERHLLDTKTRIALYWSYNHKLKSSTANMCTKTSDSKDRPQYNLRFATNLVIPKEICQGQRDKIRAFLKKQVASHFYVWFLFLSRWQGWLQIWTWIHEQWIIRILEQGQLCFASKWKNKIKDDLLPHVMYKSNSILFEHKYHFFKIHIFYSKL